MTKKTEQYIVNKFRRNGHFITANYSFRLGQNCKITMYASCALIYFGILKYIQRNQSLRALPLFNFYRLTVKHCSTLSSNQPDGGDLRGLLQSGNSIISSLGVEVRVEEQRVGARSPRILITYTPNGDTDTLWGVQASIGNLCSCQ